MLKSFDELNVAAKPDTSLSSHDPLFHHAVSDLIYFRFRQILTVAAFKTGSEKGGASAARSLKSAPLKHD